MTEEMRSEAMDTIVSGVEKHPENMELACKMIKEAMDKKFGGPWHVRTSSVARQNRPPRFASAPAPPRTPVLKRFDTYAGRRRGGFWLHGAIRSQEPVLYVLRRNGAAHRNFTVQVVCAMKTASSIWATATRRKQGALCAALSATRRPPRSPCVLCTQSARVESYPKPSLAEETSGPFFKSSSSTARRSSNAAQARSSSQCREPVRASADPGVPPADSESEPSAVRRSA